MIVAVSVHPAVEDIIRQLDLEMQDTSQRVCTFKWNVRVRVILGVLSNAGDIVQKQDDDHEVWIPSLQDMQKLPINCLPPFGEIKAPQYAGKDSETFARVVKKCWKEVRGATLRKLQCNYVAAVQSPPGTDPWRFRYWARTDYGWKKRPFFDQK